MLVALTGCRSKPPETTDSGTDTGILVLNPSEDETTSASSETTDKAKDETTSTASDKTDATEETTRTDETTSTTQGSADTTQHTEQKPTDSTENTSGTEGTTPPQTEKPVETETTKPPEEETKPPEITRPSAGEVSSLVAAYVNQYRGTPATILPGLGGVANYRAQQLVSNFAHTDGIDACNALQYGEFVDMSLYGMSENDSYYQGYNREAIAKGNWGGTAEEIARRIATGFKNSASHWKYLGSSEYSYMAVGCTYDEATSMWYCCICVSSKNYGG